MAVSAAFYINRITLVAGELTPILPQIAVAKDVVIQNATGTDLQVHSSDLGTNYIIIAAGYEREIAGNWQLYKRGSTGFWLYSAGGGTVVVMWIP